MWNVLDELEALKPEFQTLVEELNKGHAGTQLVQLDSQEKRNGYASGRASVNCPPAVGSSFSCVDKQVWIQGSYCCLKYIIIFGRLKDASVSLHSYNSTYIYLSNLFLQACYLSIVCRIIYFPAV